MKFHFRLMPAEEIPPWGTEQGQPTLSWFGLTRGYFWIEVGGQELFRYTDAVLDHWQRLYPRSLRASLPYEEYQVARYWEDLLDMLPAILDPLPDDFAKRLVDASRWRSWEEGALRWAKECGDESLDIYSTGLEWWSQRRWQAWHLAHPPRLWLWRVKDMIHIRWDNRDITVDGMLVWEAQQGEYTLSVAEFLAAVESFHARFLSKMELRVNAVRTAWSRPKVKIDFDALILEQAARPGWLEYTVRPTTVQRALSWEQVREAIAATDQAE
ncbi:MAG: hypothetical protein H8F28_20110 [Fibrella sp.]|nr:hypothetical protein [Armatimonadota bacterium]